MSSRLLITAAILLSFSCSKVSFRDLDEVVSREIFTFNETTIPSEVLLEADNHQIMMLGETHYVQEHQEWGSLLLSKLNPLGYKIFMNEMSHAYSWMVEDFVNGDLDNLPGYILYFDETWLVNIKNFNINADNTDRITFFYMDVNHSFSDLRNSLIEVEKIIGGQEIFNRVKSDAYDSEPYRESVNDLLNELDGQESIYRNEWGDLWFERIREMVEIEIPSIEFRKSSYDDIREKTIHQIINKRMIDYPDSKYVINTGMFHAQKITLMGNNIPRIAQYLETDFPGTVYSIAFIGIKGYSKYNFYDENLFSVNLIDDTKKSDLAHVIGMKAGDFLSFLPLTDPIFKEEMNVSYTKSEKMKLAPGLQFDAIISYPEISLLKSMTRYNY